MIYIRLLTNKTTFLEHSFKWLFYLNHAFYLKRLFLLQLRLKLLKNYNEFEA